MARLKCLACGHDNKVGDESCASCSSSLNLKLCSACEAINADSAARCHSCRAEFGADSELALLVSPQGLMDEAPRSEKALPATWRIAAERAREGSRRSTAALWLIPLLAVGLSYYAYAAFQRPPREALAVPPSVQPKQAPAAPMTPEVAKTAPAPVVVKATQPIAQPKRARVTHTRAAMSEAQAAAGPTAGVSAAAVFGASAAEKRVNESAGCAPAVDALGLCNSK